jgi:GntR family transcriptional repressor for pyruvate dehydrogenase complex
MLKAVKQKRIYQDIVAQIQQLLADGRLKPGQQLPSERELSELFQVSRASVREAIRALDSMGLVEIRSGEGTYVASTVDSLLSPLAFAIRPQGDNLREVFEARRIVEPAIAALAAERANPSEIRRLEAILEEQAQHVSKGETGVEADSAFHSTLAQAAKNKVFLRLDDAMVQSLREVRERSLQADGRPARSLAGHQKILRAIRAKDPAKARQAMLEHLEAIERNIMRLRARERKRGSRRYLVRLSRAR